MFVELNSMIREEGECKKPIRALLLVSSHCSREKSTEIGKSLLAIFTVSSLSISVLFSSPFSDAVMEWALLVLRLNLFSTVRAQKENADKPVNVKEWKFLQPYLQLLIIITVETSSGVLSREMTFKAESFSIRSESKENFGKRKTLETVAANLFLLHETFFYLATSFLFPFFTESAWKWQKKTFVFDKLESEETFHHVRAFSIDVCLLCCNKFHTWP